MNNRARHGLTTLVNNLPTDRRWLMHGQNQVFRRAFWTRNHRTVGAFVQIALPVNLPQVALAFRSKRPGSCRDRLDFELTIGTGTRVQLAPPAVVLRPSAPPIPMPKIGSLLIFILVPPTEPTIAR